LFVKSLAVERDQQRESESQISEYAFLIFRVVRSFKTKFQLSVGAINEDVGGADAEEVTKVLTLSDKPKVDGNEVETPGSFITNIIVFEENVDLAVSKREVFKFKAPLKRQSILMNQNETIAMVLDKNQVKRIMAESILV
jgi:hypothetical protein